MTNDLAKQDKDKNIETLPQTESAALISMIERAARDPNVDVDKVMRLYELHKDAKADRDRAAFNKALASAQSELKPVAAKLRNTQTNSNYADLAAISDAADPIIHKYGLGCITSEFKSELPGHVGVRIKVTHEAGHSESYDFNIPVDDKGLKGTVNKTVTHAYASTLTYGRRYAKCAVFDIAIKNDKDGNQASDTLTDEQVADLKALIKETNTDMARFLERGGFADLSEIPAKQFEAAKAILLKKKREQEAAK